MKINYFIGISAAFSKKQYRFRGKSKSFISNATKTMLLNTVMILTLISLNFFLIAKIK